MPLARRLEAVLRVGVGPAAVARRLALRLRRGVVAWIDRLVRPFRRTPKIHPMPVTQAVALRRGGELLADLRDILLGLVSLQFEANPPGRCSCEDASRCLASAWPMSVHPPSRIGRGPIIHRDWFPQRPREKALQKGVMGNRGRCCPKVSLTQLDSPGLAEPPEKRGNS